MDDKAKKMVEDYIEKQEAIKRKKIEQDLIDRGLYVLEYSDEAKKGYTYDQKTEKYVRKVPIEISPEDYERIKKYPLNRKLRSNFSVMLNIIGIVIIISGFIFSIVMPINNAFILIGIWLSSFIVGNIYFALAYLISVLNNEKD